MIGLRSYQLDQGMAVAVMIGTVIHVLSGLRIGYEAHPGTVDADRSFLYLTDHRTDEQIAADGDEPCRLFTNAGYVYAPRSTP